MQVEQLLDRLGVDPKQVKGGSLAVHSLLMGN